MLPNFARFASAPIGPLLAAHNGGLLLATNADGATLNGHGRSDVAVEAGVRGAEFGFFGDAALSAVIGVVQSAANSTSMVGNTGIGWRLATGEILVDGAIVASGLPAVTKGDLVGVRVQLDGGSPSIQFYLGAAQVHSRALAAAAWHFAVSLAAATAGGLMCLVNAGQWIARGPAARASWYAAPTPLQARLSDLDHLSSATDMLAHARYEGLLVDGLTTVAQIGFWPWTDEPPVRAGAASCRLLDPDGLLDDLVLQDLQGAPVTIRLGNRKGDVDSAPTVARYAADRIEIQDDKAKTLTMSDAHVDLDLPVSRGVFLPNVLNAALHWTPLPVVIGAVASVPAQVCNSDGTALFLADAPLAEISVVMDRGDVMEPGTYTVQAGGQQLTMASPSMGPVVCDVSSIGPDMAPATLLQFLHAVFGRIGKTSWSAADAAAIDAATGYAGVGYYTREAGDVASVRQALARVLPSYGAWWWQDDSGVLRFSRIVAPESYVGNLAFDLKRGDLEGDLVMMPDLAPKLSRRWFYRPNAQALGASDLVTDVVDVPQWRRDELTSLQRGQVYAGGALPTRYRHADKVTPFVSHFWRSQDAQTEADRVVAMYGVVRNFYALTFFGAPGEAPKPGQIGRLTYPKYGLDAGKQLLVRSRVYNPVTGKTTLSLWG